MDKYLLTCEKKKTRKSSKIIVGHLTSRKLTTTTMMANFEDSSASFVFVFCCHLDASCVLRFVLHAVYQCNHFMCTTGQLLIYDSPKAKLNFPLVIYVSWLFSVFSRVETTFVNRVSHRESRYLDLLIPSRQVMSFKCRAKDLSRARELSKGHTSSREMIGEKNYWNELHE